MFEELTIEEIYAIDGGKAYKIGEFAGYTLAKAADIAQFIADYGPLALDWVSRNPWIWGLFL